MDSLTEQHAIRYIKELLLALSYLHKNSIAHLDIKPENILLTGGESPSVVLSDFGDAVRINKRVPYQHELKGNPEFAGNFHILVLDGRLHSVLYHKASNFNYLVMNI